MATFPTVNPAAATILTASRSNKTPAAPAHSGRSVPTFLPRSPSPAAENNASQAACAATSPSECPLSPVSPGQYNPARFIGRPTPKGWTSTATPTLGTIGTISPDINWTAAHHQDDASQLCRPMIAPSHQPDPPISPADELGKQLTAGSSVVGRRCNQQPSTSSSRASALSSLVFSASASSLTRICRALASMRFSPADRPRSLSLRQRSLTTSATLFTSPEASFSRLALYLRDQLVGSSVCGARSTSKTLSRPSCPTTSLTPTSSALSAGTRTVRSPLSTLRTR